MLFRSVWEDPGSSLRHEGDGPSSDPTFIHPVGDGWLEHRELVLFDRDIAGHGFLCCDVGRALWDDLLAKSNGDWHQPRHCIFSVPRGGDLHVDHADVSRIVRSATGTILDDYLGWRDWALSSDWKPKSIPRDYADLVFASVSHLLCDYKFHTSGPGVDRVLHSDSFVCICDGSDVDSGFE